MPMSTGKVWVIGLVGAFVGGGFAALVDAASLASLDPNGHFALGTRLWWAKIVITLISTGGASAKLYLASHPFEQLLSEISVKSTDPSGAVTTIKQTVEKSDPPPSV